MVAPANYDNQLTEIAQGYKCTYEITGHVLMEMMLAGIVEAKGSCIGCQGDGCGSPNVCSICTLCGGAQVSRDVKAFEVVQHETLTMIDLSAFLWGFRGRSRA